MSRLVTGKPKGRLNVLMSPPECGGVVRTHVLYVASSWSEFSPVLPDTPFEGRYRDRTPYTLTYARHGRADMSAPETSDRSAQSDTRLRDRHVVVTGGAQGIGRGIAVRCARAGADVTVFDLDTETAAETADAVRGLGREAAVVEVDVADEASVDRGVEEAVATFGPINGVVNNAGIQRSVPLLETSEAEWDRHFAVNAKGTFLVAKRVAGQMIADDVAGSIVNISSVGAERPFTGQGAYGASKAAVLTLTTVLAKELAEHGITANAIKPGTVETPMVTQWLEEKAAQSGQSPDEVLSESLSSHILDRPAQPEEIGHVAVLLLSDEGEWITGESIAVDGGYLKG